MVPNINSTPAAKPTILYAEDNKLNAKIATVLLKQKYHVEIAPDGAKAVEMFEASPGKFIGVLMDMHMPNMDGIEATIKIRKLEKKLGTKQIPIIAFTTDSEFKNTSIKAGCTCYLSKPAKKEALNRTIATYCVA